MVKNALFWVALLFSTPHSYSADGTRENQLHIQLRNALYQPNQNRDKALIKLLINQLNENGEALLHIAVRSGDQKLTRLLVEAQADINKASKNETTPLWISTYNGHQKITHLLIKRRADINRPRRDGVTPLYIAAYNGQKKSAKLLIEARAHLDQPRQNGTTPAHAAAYRNSPEIIALLTQARANINQPQTDGATPLYVAAYYGHLEITQLLTQAHANVNHPRQNGTTALYVASQNNHLAIAQFLVDAGADIGHITKYDWESLERAIFNGHVEIIKILIESYRHQLERLYTLKTIENDEIKMLPAKNGEDLSSFPDEIINTYIIPLLSPQDLATFRLVSKQCRLLACDERIKQKKCNYIHHKLNDLIRKALFKNKNIQRNVIAVLESYLQKEYVKKMMPTPKEVAPILNRRCNIS